MSAKKAVLGIVSTRAQAETIISDLRDHGFTMSDVSVIWSDPQVTRDFALEQGSKAPEGAITGLSAGGIVGGMLGLLAGMGLLVIPGIGPILAAGPIAVALGGLAAGAAVGGIAGGLIGMGIPEIHAKQYEGQISRGSVLVSVHVEEALSRRVAKEIFERRGATSILVVDEHPVPKAA